MGPFLRRNLKEELVRIWSLDLSSHSTLTSNLSFDQRLVYAEKLGFFQSNFKLSTFPQPFLSKGAPLKAQLSISFSKPKTFTFLLSLCSSSTKTSFNSSTFGYIINFHSGQVPWLLLLALHHSGYFNPFGCFCSCSLGESFCFWITKFTQSSIFGNGNI